MSSTTTARLGWKKRNGGIGPPEMVLRGAFQQLYSPFSVWKTVRVPLVAIHVRKRFQVVPGTNSIDSWLEQAEHLADEWERFSTRKLLHRIDQCA